jgi:hypothetical protein
MMKCCSPVVLALICCCNSGLEQDVEVIEITEITESDSAFQFQDVAVVSTYWKGFGGDGYLVNLNFQGDDTIRNAKVFLGSDLLYDGARYYWVSDTSINITLFDSKGDSTFSMIAGGSMDGSTSSMELLN